MLVACRVVHLLVCLLCPGMKEGFRQKEYSCLNSAPLGWAVVNRYALDRVHVG